MSPPQKWLRVTACEKKVTHLIFLPCVSPLRPEFVSLFIANNRLTIDGNGARSFTRIRDVYGFIRKRIKTFPRHVVTHYDMLTN